MKTGGRTAKFEDIAEFVGSAAESANVPIYSRQALYRSETPHRVVANKNSNKKPQLPKQKTSNFATNVKLPVTPQSRRNTIPQDTSSRCCLLYANAHDIDNCESFRKKPVEERKSFLTEKRLCYGCYGTNHVSRNCTNKRTCQKCGKRHP